MQDTNGFTINSSAIPIDVGDSSGGITTASSTHTIDGDSPEYAINQLLSLNDSDAGVYKGTIVSVKKNKNAGLVSFDSESLMNKLTTTQRASSVYRGMTIKTKRKVYPIYRGTGIPTYLVSAAVDHWTQEYSLFYDRVPGQVIAYNSMFGHDNMYTPTITLPPQEVPSVGGTPVMPSYRDTGTRVVRTLPVNGVIGMPMARLTSLSGKQAAINSGLTPSQAALLAKQEAGLALSMPKATDTTQLVFSIGFVVTAGAARAGNVDWNFNNGSIGAPNTGSLRLAFDTAAGFSLWTAEGAGAFTSQLSSLGQPIPAGTYRAYIGLQEASPTQTGITLKVVNESANTVYMSSWAPTVTTALRGNLTWYNGQIVTTNAGSGNFDCFGYFASYIPTAAIPTTALGVNKQLGQTLKNVLCVPGFDGDMWASLKQLMSLHRMDLWYEDDLLKVGQRDTTARVLTNPSVGNVTVTQRKHAKRVEVVNQNSTIETGVGSVFFKATSVYQVATGQVNTFTVQTPHSIDNLNQPQPQTGITPYPYLNGGGQYVVTGSDGYIVSPSWWNDNGGQVVVSMTTKPGEIQVTIKGPDYDSVRSPYRISEGDAGRPALYITGQGILNVPETLQIPTGNPQASDDIGEQINIPFITTRELAYNAAVQAAVKYGSPDAQLTIRESRVDGEVAALARKPAGAIITHEGNNYRVHTAALGPSGIAVGGAAQYNSILAVNAANAGKTIAQTNTYKNGMTLKDSAIKRLKTS